MVQVKNEFEELNSVEEMCAYLKDRLYYSEETYTYMYPIMSELYEGRGFRIIDLFCLFAEFKPNNDEEIKEHLSYIHKRKYKYRLFNLTNGNKLYYMEENNG